ncbi:MAG: GNAT family N-acetyltransferase [Candidatus Dependentiae bacterium]|nr:GNAT family N-acetyltransferase [Candidatus Dependentiae bacterium]
MRQRLQYLTFRSRILWGLVAAILVGIGAYYWRCGCLVADPIEVYQPARDREAVERLFEQNWYWLINVPYEAAMRVFAEDLDKAVSPMERKKPDAFKWLVFRQGGVLQGFTAYYVKSPGVGRIVFLAVDEHARGKGCASRLIQRALNALSEAGCKTILILVRIENFRAQNLYRKFGFEAVKTDETFMYMERHSG